MLTFAGEGYSPEFIANFHRIVDRIRDGVPVVLVNGPDDICAVLHCAHEPPHCRDVSISMRDTAAGVALGGIVPSGALAAGSTIVFDAGLIAELRVRFASGEIRRACTGCEWSDLCTSIAARNFAQTAL